MFFGFQPIPSDKQRISWQGGSSCVNTYKKRSNVLMVIIASFTPKQAMILIDKYYLIRLDNASIYPTFPIYISNVSHLYIQRLPSIYPTHTVYISNTVKHVNFPAQKFLYGIAFIKHETSRACSIDWRLKVEKFFLQKILSAGKPMDRAVDERWKEWRKVRTLATLMLASAK